MTASAAAWKPTMINERTKDILWLAGLVLATVAIFVVLAMTADIWMEM